LNSTLLCAPAMLASRLNVTVITARRIIVLLVAERSV
jgi:hypothetical protein